MPAAGTNVFAGLRPKTASHLLEDANASICSNVYLVDGRLRALRDRREEPTLPVNARTIYKWEDHPYWLTWTERVDVARSINPAIDRLYFTGDGEPKVGQMGIDIGEVFSGAPPYPNETFLLGVPKPGNAPTLVVTVAEPDPDRDYTQLDTETRFYAYTYVNEWGEESARSPISMVLECYDDAHVTVTFSNTAAAGYVPVVAVRIYRTNTGTEATAFQFVGEVNIAAGTYLDTVASAYLSEVQETFGWEVPPADLHSLTAVGGQFFAGISGRDVCFSETLVPSAWPLEYRFALDDEPVGGATNGVDYVVLTRGRPVVFVGNTPAGMQRIKLADYQPCMSRDSITAFNGMVVYASPDGLIGISSSQGFQNLTGDILTRDQWTAFDPSSMKVVVFEQFLYLSSDVGAWLFDIDARTYTVVDTGFDAAFYDGYEDILYVTEGTALYSFNMGDLLVYEWVSKDYTMLDVSPVCARVHAETYDQLHFELYGDGDRILRLRVRGPDMFRLPAIRSRTLAYRLTGTDTVRSASVGTNPAELIP